MLVVRDQLLAGAARQRGADRHRAEQVAHAREALQVGTDALPQVVQAAAAPVVGHDEAATQLDAFRSEEHTSELQSLMRIQYAVFRLKKKNQLTQQHHSRNKYPTHQQ